MVSLIKGWFTFDGYVVLQNMNEFFFWLGFVFFNAVHFLPNYLFDRKESSFFPFISDVSQRGVLGLSSSLNQDPFRFVAEISFILLAVRIADLRPLFPFIAALYLVTFLFNLYQFFYRRIYQIAPNIYNDSKLLLNGVAILWHESRVKSIAFLILPCLLLSLFYQGMLKYLHFSSALPAGTVYYSISGIFLLVILKSVFKTGFYTAYPNDIHLRFHFTVIELYQNLQRSWVYVHLSNNTIGAAFRDGRKSTPFVLKNEPDLHFIFIESYGKYFYDEPEFTKASYHLFDEFANSLSREEWLMRSNFSESPTISGQSWLTYASFFYGLKISDNTYYENFLKDPDFSQSDSLLRILKQKGYFNVHLNPIRPMKGIQVPFRHMDPFLCSGSMDTERGPWLSW